MNNIMTEDEIRNLKDKIWEGACAAPDRRCRDGFAAANKLIEYYENELLHYMRIAAVYEELFIHINKIEAEANRIKARANKK